MLREKKAQIIDQLTESLSRSTVVIATNYQGLSAKQMAELRHVLADAAVDYHVVKNTLVYFAAQRADKEQAMSIIEGPTALAFGYDDVVKPAKVLNQYSKSAGLALQIRGGLLGERVLDADDVITLASLPAREVLIAQLIAGLQSPIGSLHNILNYPLQGLSNVLQARIQKLSE
jgi:large subunit ribosomal protein L10